MNNVFYKMLEEIGKFSRADRAHIYIYSSEENIFSISHEWCASGVEPHDGKLRNISADKIPKVFEVLKNKKELVIEDKHLLKIEGGRI